MRRPLRIASEGADQPPTREPIHSRTGGDRSTPARADFRTSRTSAHWGREGGRVSEDSPEVHDIPCKTVAPHGQVDSRSAVFANGVANGGWSPSPRRAGRPGRLPS